MKACIGRDLAGEMAKSHARLLFSSSYDAFADADALLGVLDVEAETLKPGGGGRFFHLDASVVVMTDIGGARRLIAW